MSVIKKTGKALIKSVMGERAEEWIGRNYLDMEALLAVRTEPVYRESLKRLMAFKNKHKGERCFIIGNGPSLNKMDLSPLRDEITFGLNRIYLLFDSLGFATTYYACVNRYVIEQSVDEIRRLKCPKFIGLRVRDKFPFTPDTVFLRSRNGPKFCTDLRSQGIWEGATVTYVAMQIAYYMGFSEVILIGVDHNFKTKGEPNKLVLSEGDDPDHFDPNYFGKGYKWLLPDLELSEVAYELANKAFIKDGRNIKDATVDGSLDIFPKVRFEDCFKG